MHYAGGQTRLIIALPNGLSSRDSKRRKTSLRSLLIEDLLVSVLSHAADCKIYELFAHEINASLDD